jgi:hypothetical protein
VRVVVYGVASFLIAPISVQIGVVSCRKAWAGE